MQNQKTEGICESIEKTDKKLRYQALSHMGCMVKNIKPHILSDICISVDEKTSVPNIKDCTHPDERRSGQFLRSRGSTLIKVI